jgi:hypothetical protein
MQGEGRRAQGAKSNKKLLYLRASLVKNRTNRGDAEKKLGKFKIKNLCAFVVKRNAGRRAKGAGRKEQ